MIELPILLLAAGSASRMGTAKQLLPWGDKTLFEHAVDTALTLNDHPLFVVIGAHQEKLVPLVDHTTTDCVIHSEWEKGMGSSIARGVSAVCDKYPGSQGVLIFLVDQPLINTNYLSTFIAAFQSGRAQIIASEYTDGRWGVPALFDASYFKELQNLSEDFGAKKLIQKFRSHIRPISGGNLLADVDTREAYEALLKKSFS